MAVANVRGLSFAVIGGERRELEAARALLAAGAEVRLVGLPAADLPGAAAAASVAGAVAGAAAVLLPVRGIGPAGEVAAMAGGPLHFGEEALDATSGVVIVGVATPALRDGCARRGLRLSEIRERDDFAILNAVPTAEGALHAAIAALDVTLHGCRALVVGYGRTGRAVARRLHALGAATTVAARRPAARAEAREAGLGAVAFDDLGRAVAGCDIVFNTVPAPVLGGEVLARAAPGTVVLDLASGAGGTDFDAARRLGLKAQLLPGLPGRIATRTSGRILAETVLAVVVEQGLAATAAAGEAPDGVDCDDA